MPDKVDKLIRIFILDPYALIRAGIKLIIEGEPGMKVVGDAGDSAMGLEIIASQKPDIVLLKLSVIGDLGMDIIPRILETSDQTRIILLITTDDLQVCSQAVQRGAVGIVSKTQLPQTLIKAIKKVYDGEVWIEHSMMAQLINTISRPHRSRILDPETERISKLSDRERQVIQLIGVGLKNKQIASQLCVRDVTVRHHLTSVYNKLGVSDRLELLVFAHRTGMIVPKGSGSK